MLLFAKERLGEVLGVERAQVLDTLATPIHLTGMESWLLMPMTTPPLAVPSSFVRTTPVIGAAW